MLRILLIIFALSVSGGASAVVIAQHHRAAIDAAAGAGDVGRFVASPVVLVGRQEVAAGHWKAVEQADRAFVIYFLLAVGSGAAAALCVIVKLVRTLIRAARRPSERHMDFSDGDWPGE